ncbi:hypothetical protein [Alteraurantiacibacter buctensis]|uniref:PepSY domain-containing protein n=1 Tax=Alteraurantiacibacter buctensis TaxID=1503981 RepID=A0A844Z017_9SPHN|nr:hypothetical protein [Alteraurantiacibacter buctensis]MXO73159.1 hypothetical protein [Alteraurantiacibacter buctensis]
MTGQTFATALLLSASLAPGPVSAASAQARLGLTLVIAPRCTDEADPQRDLAPAVASPAAAVAIAARELATDPAALVAVHDRLATGWWLVGYPPGDGSLRPLVRIEKCSGRVERAPGQP